MRVRWVYGAALCAFACLSHAATSIVTGTASGTGAVNVQQFDPSLGTLSGVTLSLANASQSATIELDNADGNPDPETWTVTLTGGAITFGNASQTVTANPSHLQGYQVPNGNTILYPTTEAVSAGPTAYTGSLADFIGAGYVPDMSVSFSGSWSVSAPQNPRQGWKDNQHFWSVTASGGSVDWTVAYEYTPVPEPCSMGLLALGGLVVVLRRRFGQKARHPNL